MERSGKLDIEHEMTILCCPLGIKEIVFWKYLNLITKCKGDS